MNSLVLESTEKTTEILWNIGEVATTLELAVQADGSAENYGSVICVAIRELHRISEKLNTEIEKMQAWNREGEQDAEED